MIIHHLNCGTMYPAMNHHFHDMGSFQNWPPLVTHCLLVESQDGLLLVDTGFGSQDHANPTPFVRLFMKLSNFRLDPNETAIQQIQRLGYHPEDVCHIAVTHMHLDHVGGLPDFPHASVHIYAREYDAIYHPRSLEEKIVCRREHWAHGPHWVIHESGKRDWFGFDATPEIPLGEGTFFFLPLTGHTRGHAAVVVRYPDGWLMHCGDSYVYRGDVDPGGPNYPPKQATILKLMGLCTKAFRVLGAYSHRLRELRRNHGDCVQIFCAHDPAEFSHLSGEPIQFSNSPKGRR
jgi:glyoxylase-like metal-dependent hydrolase (beta-lactamase superfamily II)